MAQENHIMLSCKQDAAQFYKTKTISTNPNNQTPYMEKVVESSTTQGRVLGHDKGLFGTLGTYDYPQSWEPVRCARWEDIKPYGQHNYLIVVVLKVNDTKTKAIVYDEFRGEFPVTIGNNLPYVVSPQVGHKLLLQSRKGVADCIEYDIVHNITLAKLKWEMKQHII